MPKRGLSAQAGFTLIETLIVLSLVAVVGGLTLAVGMDSYRGYFYRSDRSILIAALEEARAQAMNGICLGNTCSSTQPHGVHLEASQLVVFQGASFDASDGANEYIGFNNLLSSSGSSDIIFAPLSGDAASTTLTTIDATGRASSVRVGASGEISWSN